MKQKFSFLLLMVTLCLNYGCFNASKMADNKVSKNSSSWLPADFKPKNGILLVQRFEGKSRKEQKWADEMEAYMLSNYSNKYEFATGEDIETAAKYKDATKYPYAMMLQRLTLEYTGVTGRTTAPVYDFYFLDRATNKKYDRTKIHSSNPVLTFKAVINTIVQER